MRLEIENLTFSYGTGARPRAGSARGPAATPPLFENFNLEVASGEITAILGQSGCGKSTLLRIVSGLEEGARGQIRLGGRVFQGPSDFIPVERRNVGFMFQDYALFPFMTVAQNICFGMKKGMKKGRSQGQGQGQTPAQGKDLQDLLALTQLRGLAHRYPHELSGGQQQRTALARTLASKPDLLLMDEPFSSLDAGLVKALRADLREIIAATQLTTLVVTHNEEDAIHLAHRILRL